MVVSVFLLTLTLGGCGSSGGTITVNATSYRAYLQRNSTLLVAALQSMLHEIRDRQVARAESRYARARVRYSQIEPAAEEFTHLNRKIDGLEQEVPPSMFGGFHRIEKALWLEETTAGMTPVAERLVDDVKRLQARFKSRHFSASELVDDMSRLLTEISNSKLKGKEEPYSNTTLVDVSANIEAVMAAAEALQVDPGLEAVLHSRLRRAYAEMTRWGDPASDPEQTRGRSPGAIFVWFEDLSPSDIAKIKQLIEAIEKPVSELQTQLGQS